MPVFTESIITRCIMHETAQMYLVIVTKVHRRYDIFYTTFFNVAQACKVGLKLDQSRHDGGVKSSAESSANSCSILTSAQHRY